MADKGTDSRLKLTITEVKERQPVGDKGAVKLAFMATEGDGKALPYFTFSSRLFETIEQGKGKELDCNVNISKRIWERDGEPMEFTDRKVTQIYIDGQPIGGKKWGGGYQDSPEKIASIENQKRADIIAQLWIADKFNEKTPEVIKMRKWLMGDTVPPAKATPKTEAKSAPKGKWTAPAKEPDPEDIFPEEESPKANIDSAWLEETLELIHWKEATALSWVKANLKVEATGKLLDVCNKLPADKLEQFVAKLQDMREAAGS